MKPKEAIRILMNSPFYFHMDLLARQKMIRDFCELHTRPVS